MKSVLVILLLGAAALISGPGKAAPEKPVRSVSPDKQWEFRHSASGEKSELIKRGTTQVVLDLTDEDCGEGTPVWAPDSKRFAFNCYTKPTSNNSVFYELQGGEWIKLRSLADDMGPIIEDADTAEIKKKYGSKAHDVPSVIIDHFAASRWTSATTLIVKAEECLGVDVDYLRLEFVFTVHFDADGNWKIVKTSRTKKSGWTDDCFN